MKYRKQLHHTHLVWLRISTSKHFKTINFVMHKKFRVISPLQTPDASNEAVEVGEGGRTDNGGGSVVYSFPAASTPALSDAAPNNASVAGTQWTVKEGTRDSIHESTDTVSGGCTGRQAGRHELTETQRHLVAGIQRTVKEGTRASRLEPTETLGRCTGGGQGRGPELVDINYQDT